MSRLITALAFLLLLTSQAFGQEMEDLDFETARPYMVTIGDSITSGLFANYNLDNPPSKFEVAYLAYLAASGNLKHKEDRVHNGFKRFDLNWSTGTKADDVVFSHYERLKQFIPDLETFDLAHSGDETWDLVPQSIALIEEIQKRNLEPVYVTVLMGANDLCAVHTKDVTTKSDFRKNVEDGLSIILENTEETKVLVSSIPNIFALQPNANEKIWGISQTEFKVVSCQDMWETFFPVCKTGTVNKNPRRWEQMQEQLRAYNKILEEKVEEMDQRYPGRIKFSPSVFETPIVREDLSFDCFHPSEHGHARLADMTWEEGFWPDL